jgi:hypothetical protein
MSKAGSKRPVNINIEGSEWVSPAGARQLLGGMSKATYWRLRAYKNFPRGQRPGGLDMELISVASIREWMALQPTCEEVTSSRGHRGGARLISEQSVTE